VVLLGAVLLTLAVSGEEEPSFESDLIEAVKESPLPGLAVANLVYAVSHTEYDVAVGVGLAAVLFVSGSRRSAVLLCALLFVLLLAQGELKDLVDRERPPYDPDDLWSEPTSASFPSGHAMSATVVYGWLLFSALHEGWPRRWRRTAAGVAMVGLLLPGLAGVYLGVHWPSDIVGGYLWGLTLVLPAVWLVRTSPSEMRATLRGRRP
jgi:undecaprenyl-diphosphatase